MLLVFLSGLDSGFGWFLPSFWVATLGVLIGVAVWFHPNLVLKGVRVVTEWGSVRVRDVVSLGRCWSRCRLHLFQVVVVCAGPIVAGLVAAVAGVSGWVDFFVPH